MNDKGLESLLGLVAGPKPWAEGEKIPWNDPDFSARMLREHLSQAHDAASRRTERIDAHVEWLHGHVLSARPGRVLDLGCGPGFHTHRLAGLGHECVGVDFSPASVAHAREHAPASGCTFVEGDVRCVDYGEGFGLVMMLFGELNVFRPEDAATIVRKAHRALSPGGRVVLEVHTWEGVEAIAERPRSWRIMGQGGLFSARPHLWLSEAHWHEASRTVVERHVIVDLGDGSVQVYGATVQAYSPEGIRDLLTEAGFVGIDRFPSLGEGERDPDYEVLCARVRDEA